MVIDLNPLGARVIVEEKLREDAVRILRFLAGTVSGSPPVQGQEVQGSTSEIDVQATAAGDAFAPSTETLSHHTFRLCMVPVDDGRGVLRFTNSRFLPGLLKGKVLRVEGRLTRCPVNLSGEVLAEWDGVPVWSARNQHGLRHDECLQPKPWITQDPRIFEHLKGCHFLRCVPFIEWLRALTGWDSWSKPRLQACFMFDDPNFHATRYGFIDYDSLRRAAEEHNFAVAFATIPLDCWYVSQRAARVFRESAGRLSFLVHGNNHTFRELASGTDFAAYNAAFGQALERIRRIERKAGLDIARVIAPPHGAFALAALGAAAAVGFEGACLSWGSIWSSNRNPAWTPLLGADPGAIIEGLGILPRFRLRPDDYEQLLLSAYLQQPIIPVGHHSDLGREPEVLLEVAGYLNGLGEVSWCDVGKLLRRNYWCKTSGDLMEVLSFSSDVDIGVPQGVAHLKITPLLRGRLSEEYSVSLTGSAGRPVRAETDKAGSFWVPCAGPETVRVTVRLTSSPACEDTPAPRTPARSFLRRALSEARDRLLPYVPRALRELH